MKTNFEKGTFGYDREFLRTHVIEFAELKDATGQGAILVVPGWQGRVMTSTSGGDTGRSYGWINYRYISSGKLNDQFNPFGGEERIWLGPEGGPFSIYFPEDAEQVFSNWRVPPELDTKPFRIVEKDAYGIKLSDEFEIENSSGAKLGIGIERKVRLLERAEASEALGVIIGRDVSFVGYESVNTLINRGEEDWNSVTGFLSIWILSMFNPSEKGIVIIPFRPGNTDLLGPKVNDNYFGKVPPERLVVRDSILFFRVDGRMRGKIGISPLRAKPVCGSYDPDGKVLTILWYSAPGYPMKYVNSKWGRQDDPLDGDVVNSYNDGPTEDGSIMGPFYEIESSSPAAILKSGDNITHVQRIFHFSGNETILSSMAESILGISLDEVKNAFER